MVFERIESIEFLLKKTRQEDTQLANALAAALGDLPLALEQAGAYIEETCISFTDYLRRFLEYRKKLLMRTASNYLMLLLVSGIFPSSQFRRNRQLVWTCSISFPS